MIPSIPPRGSRPIVEAGDQKGQFTILWWGWLDKLFLLLRGGFTGTVTTAKLTPGGSNGSQVFQNGVLVSQTQAT